MAAIKSNPYPALALLYSRLANWNFISDFQDALTEYFHGERCPAEIADYRARRGHLKKLRDEVVPVSSYVTFICFTGEIRFQLNDSIPDCWVRQTPTSNPLGMEVTVAQAREQQALGEELNTKGIGRGFLGLYDEASSTAFRERLSRPRAMYSTEQAVKIVCGGIKRSIEKKNKSKYKDFSLLVEAPLSLLPDERWSAIEDELRIAAASKPFQKIYIISNRDTRLYGFPIK